MVLLSICIATRNEEMTIIETIHRLHEILVNNHISHEFVIVDAGSNDRTGHAIRKILTLIEMDSQVFFIKSTTYLKAYCRSVLEAKGDYIFIIDGDLQYMPEEIMSMWSLRDKYDIINGVKISRHDPIFRKIESKFYHFFVGLSFMKWFGDPNTGFRLFNRNILVDIVPQMKWLHNSPGTEMLYRAYVKGYKIKEIGIRHFSRRYGRSKLFDVYEFGGMFSVQFHGLYHLWKDLI